jgi:hypothetical protein
MGSERWLALRHPVFTTVEMQNFKACDPEKRVTLEFVSRRATESALMDTHHGDAPGVSPELPEGS